MKSVRQACSSLGQSYSFPCESVWCWLFYMSGIIPLSRESCQIMKSGCARVLLHFLRSIAGKPSGPAAELGCTSLIAFINFSSVNGISTFFQGLTAHQGTFQISLCQWTWVGWRPMHTELIGFKTSSLDLISTSLLSWGGVQHQSWFWRKTWHTSRNTLGSSWCCLPPSFLVLPAVCGVTAGASFQFLLDVPWVISS